MLPRAVSVRFPARSATLRPSSLYSRPRSSSPRSVSMLPRAVKHLDNAAGAEPSVARSIAAFMWTAASARRPWVRSKSAISLRTSRPPKDRGGPSDGLEPRPVGQAPSHDSCGSVQSRRSFEGGAAPTQPVRSPHTGGRRCGILREPVGGRPTLGGRLRRPRAGRIPQRGQGLPGQPSSGPQGGPLQEGDLGGPFPGMSDTNRSPSDLPTPQGDTFPPDGRAYRNRPRSRLRQGNGTCVVGPPAIDP